MREDRRGLAGVARGLAVLVFASLAGGCGYGRIQELGEAVLAARSRIEVQLMRRSELVPNLLETVQAYGMGARGVIGSVADARADLVGAVRSGSVAKMEVASAELSGALDRLLGGARRSPQLEEDLGFQLLRSQLDSTEERITEAGREYNDAVRIYNAYIGQFPQAVTAKVIGAEALQFFEPRAGQSDIASADG